MNKEMLPSEITICGCFAHQPIGEFFVGIIPAYILCEITYADTRRLSDRKIETYTGINRPISPTRTKEICQYVNNVDATFPNSIIIAIGSEAIKKQSERELTIVVGKDVAKIIDGQHRIGGLEKALEQSNGRPMQFDLVVSIFVDLPMEDQASIFSTINLKQTQVSKSLVYDLFELDPERSPQKTCHNIAKSVNSNPRSPFFQKIKLLGRNPKLDDGQVLYRAPLTQAAFIKYLLPMISDDPEHDRELLKTGKSVECPDNAVEKGIIFCRYFAREEDSTITRIINNYFGAVREVFPIEWEDDGNPLSKTVGYGALMRLLKSDLFPIADREDDLSQDMFATYFRKAKGHINFSFKEYAPAGKGETELYRALKYRVVGNA